MRILVIEDEPRLGDYLQQGLEGSGYVVDVTRDGGAARTLAAAGRHALVLLDVARPGPEGFATLQAIRRASNVPVLVLTSRDRVEDRVTGLQLGADDYLVKPFSFAELLSRAQALLRRGKRRPPHVLRLADLELDLANRSCTRGQQSIELTAKEFALLQALMRAPGAVLSRADLARQVWDDKLDGDTNVIEVAVRRLRGKIDDPFAARLLHTVRGQGYMLEDRS